MAKPKAIGTQAETDTVKFLKMYGFPEAHRRALTGVLDQGDVWLNSKGQCIIQVKGGKMAETASDNQVELWLKATDRQRVNSRAEVGVLVMKRAAYGGERAGSWWAILSWADHCRLLGLMHIHDPHMGPVRLKLSTATDLLLRAYGDTYRAVDVPELPESTERTETRSQLWPV